MATLGLGALFAAGCAHLEPAGGTVPAARLQPARCFDLSALGAEDQARADEILLAFADGEGLYTLAGGLKPLSSGQALIVRLTPEVDAAALERLEQRRRVASSLRCGEIEVFVHAFVAPQQGKSGERSLTTELVVAHRRSVAAAIRRHAVFFASLGITPSSAPAEAMRIVESAPRAERWRGYGYLFGYPDAAVDFFVAAGREGDAAGHVVPRDFRRIDTVRRHPATEGGAPVLPTFVYAVPAGAHESPDDRALRELAAPIYSAYVAQRRTRIRPDGTGSVDLWRAWTEEGATGAAAAGH